MSVSVGRSATPRGEDANTENIHITVMRADTGALFTKNTHKISYLRDRKITVLFGLRNFTSEYGDFVLTTQAFFDE